MSVYTSEALASAKQLCRTLASAPGPSDGLEVARQILAGRPTRIAFSSAWNDPRTLAAIEGLGAYANIPKPCREAELVAVAERAWGELCSVSASS